MSLQLAMVTDVFPGQPAWDRLGDRLREAKAAGAELAVLPELGLDPWVPCRREARDADAEVPGGPRHRALADSASAAGLAVMGGAIVREPTSGERRNRALLYGSDGNLLSSFDKVHVPWEDGYWERDHYGPGGTPPSPVRVGDVLVGLQICSDLQRPGLIFALAAAGVELVLAPRCTPTSSYESWRRVIRSVAMMAGVFVVSVNRPGPEGGVPIGGASIAVGPEGEVLAESTDPIATVEIDPARVAAARADYPGYLAWPSDVYAEAWSTVRPVPGPGESSPE